MAPPVMHIIAERKTLIMQNEEWRAEYPWYANPQFVAVAEPTLYAGLRRAGFPEE